MRSSRSLGFVPFDQIEASLTLRHLVTEIFVFDYSLSTLFSSFHTSANSNRAQIVTSSSHQRPPERKYKSGKIIIFGCCPLFSPLIPPIRPTDHPKNDTSTLNSLSCSCLRASSPSLSLSKQFCGLIFVSSFRGGII